MEATHEPQTIHHSAAVPARHDAVVRNIESHLGQIATSLNTRAQRSLSGDTDVPSTTSPKVVLTLPNSPLEKIKAVTLTSGKATTQLTTLPEKKEQNKASEAALKAQQQQPATDEQKPEPGKEAKAKENQVDRSQPISLTLSRQIPTKILFPQRKKKQQDDKQFGKFLDILKQLHINIPLVDALEQMPSNFTDADKSIVKPEGKIEDLLVKVDKFILPADFIILDYEADIDVPIILGRPFLATGRAFINVQKWELSMRVHDDEIKFKFNIVKAMKFQDEEEDLEECSALTLLDNQFSRKTEGEEYEEEEEGPQKE
ncbi:uncharacterized protein LOC133298454 [Gastrolobium bilobum]|uniref:uncharacterized protein LOC133298454 n=1 Tax=Gastrolobium bilobum TaxID=150636 RepID=UPI002AB13EAC|nr:uncharacterized protein LOC133298454 [Gastrolobium bilobum]